MSRNSNDFEPTEVTENEIYRFMTSLWISHNQMSWNRLQMMLALETASLVGAFSKPGLLGTVALLIASALIFVLYKMILRDWDIRDQHRSLLDRVHDPLAIRLIIAPRSWHERGQHLLQITVSLLVCMNLLIVGLYLAGWRPSL